MNKKHDWWWPYAGMAVCIGMLFLAGYASVYYVTVKRHLTYFSSFSGCPIAYYAPTYSVLPTSPAQAVFGPMHCLDLRLRPEFWNPPAPLPDDGDPLGVEEE